MEQAPRVGRQAEKGTSELHRKVIGILQPTYLPWLGYFEQMAYVDHFVFYDDVQYTRHDWRNRNRILTKNGPIWLTVPVKKDGLHALISQVEIDNSKNWRSKHLRSIRHSYQSAPNFLPFFQLLEGRLFNEWSHISDLDIDLIETIGRWLGIETETSRSSEIAGGAGVNSMPDDSNLDETQFRINRRVVEVCRHHGADVLYEGAKAADYIDVDYFRGYGIEVVFQDYRHPVYPQCYPGFCSHMSAIDLITNCGPKAREILLSSPVPDVLKG